MRLKSLAIILGCSALGFAGNCLAVSIGFNVHFIFGSIFSILALGFAGWGGGIITAILASTYTFVLWNHPYAIIIFTAETAWVGFWLKKNRTNIVLMDFSYWACLGLPLVFAFYAGIMGLDLQIAQVVAIKMMVNGAFNALIASILLAHPRLYHWLSNSRSTLQTPLSQILFYLSIFFLLVPSLGIMMYSNASEQIRAEARAAQSIYLEAQETEVVLKNWLQSHFKAIESIAQLGERYPLKPSARLQEEIEKIHRLFPDLHYVFIGNPDATAIAFDPPVNENGVSAIGGNFKDHPWFQKLARTRQPVISEVFVGQGGVSQPVFSISSPLVHDNKLAGFGLGAFDLDRLKRVLFETANLEGEVVSLLDQNGRVIVSSSDQRKPLDPLEDLVNSTLVPTSQKDVFISVPATENNISIMSVWRNACFVTKSLLPGTSWTLMVELPVKPLQSHLYAISIRNLTIVAVLLLAALALALWISRVLGKPAEDISRLSIDLPKKIERNEPLQWPETSIQELSVLIDNFQVMAEALGRRIRETRQTNENLEQIVTERTEKLAVSEERLRAILDAAPIAIGRADDKGRITYINGKFRDFFGYTLDEITNIDQWYLRAYPDESYRQSLETSWDHESQRARKEIRDLTPIEVKITCKDGSVRDVIIAGTWVNEEIVVFFSDFTHHRQATAKAQEMARLSSLGEMASGVAHEINNPVAGIISCAELLHSRLPVDDPSQRVVDRIIREGDRVAKIVKSLLLISHPGQQKLETFSVEDGFETILSLVQHGLFKDGIDISIEMPSEQLFVTAERQQFEQMLLNLINNSRYALNARFDQPHPEKKLTIKASRIESDEEQRLALEIYDQGTGIPKEVLGKVFDPFFTTKPAGIGTGLGLGLCYEIARRHNGKIRIDSEFGQFTRVTVELPLTKVENKPSVITPFLGTADINQPPERPAAGPSSA